MPPDNYISKPQHPTYNQWGLLLCIAWILFVVYGSLVPLEYKFLPWETAIQRFQNAPFLQLGAESRADWIANGVLYVGVGFLSMASLTQPQSTFWGKTIALLISLSGGFLLATGVEFTQLYFPQRTVSLNDILAEYIGTFVGVTIAWRYARSYHDVLNHLGQHLHSSMHVLLPAYALAYLVYALFPYDIVLSGSELLHKLQSEKWGWLMAGAPTIKRWAVLFAEVALTVPLGLWWAARSHRATYSSTKAFWHGALLGLILEVFQLFLYTGVSQGLSIFARAVGAMIGAAAWKHRSEWSLPRWQKLYQNAPITSWIGYLVLISLLSGWWNGPIQNWNVVLTKLNQIRFIPFYYHYYTTEALALFSVASLGLMYGGLGGLTWLAGCKPVVSAALVAVIALVIEGGKLFFGNSHPDPTNVLLAPWMAMAINALLHKLVYQGVLPHKEFTPAPPPGTRTSVAAPLQALFSSAVLTGVAIWVSGFPTQPLLLGLGLALYAFSLWKRPVLLFAGLPLALPLLDLAPWSGRIFFDEFDALVLTSLAIGYWRIPRNGPLPDPATRAQKFAFGLLGVSYLVSTAMTLQGAAWADLTTTTHYFSPLNALRISKGFLWAYLLWALSRRAYQQGLPVFEKVQAGMVLGLGGVLAFIVWERAAFAGLLDFNDQYRISGPMSAMHTGGAYIEAYLVMASVFLMHGITHWQRAWARLAGLLMLALTSYAVMVTYSRGGYGAYAAVLVVMSVAVAWRPARRYQRWLALGMLPIAVAAAMPAFLGTFAQRRFTTVESDLEVRQEHWTGSLAPAHNTWATLLFGEGVGRFPSFRYWGVEPEKRIAQHLVTTDPQGNSYLVLGTGLPVYVDQIISPPPHTQLALQVKLRSPQAGQGVTILICRKWLLSSYDCQSQGAKATQPNTWEVFNLSINTGPVGAHSALLEGTDKLSLFSNGKGKVDIDHVQLTTPSGDALLDNGTFNQGMDHWHFTDDNHLAWHVKSLPLSIFFSLGGLGCVAWLYFLGVFWLQKHKAQSARQVSEKGLHTAILACILGVGFFDSLIDTPRILLLVLLVSALAPNRPLKKCSSKLPPHRAHRFSAGAERL